MKVFLSYASQDRALASTINRALLHQGHDVFFDRDDLPPAEEFHNRIRRGIEGSDLFVFLISEHAIDPASYTLSELEIAEKVIERPHGRVLPVLIAPIVFERVPGYLKSVTVLQTSGDITAAVAAQVHRIALRRRTRLWFRVTIGVAALALVLAGIWAALRDGNLPQEQIGTDGAPAHLVAAGAFVMGDGEHSPRREVFVEAFYIDRFEITTSRYARFLAATDSVRPPDKWEDGGAAADPELPVIGVDWHDAAAYCTWAGRRLPTEAEWEKAARGSDGRMFPWGNESAALDRANYMNSSPLAYDGGLHRIGAHPSGRSPYGVHDMAGNVNEWVADWYSESVRAEDARNPTGAQSGSSRVIRGGGRYEHEDRIRSTRRYHGAPDLRGDDIGFRCASDAR